MAYMRENVIDKLKEISSELREKKLASIYYLYGIEEYFLDSLEKNIKKTFDDPVKLNIKIFDDETIKPLEIYKHLIALPTMNDKKLIICKNIKFMKGKTTKEAKTLLESLESNLGSNILVIIEKEQKKGYDKFYTKDNLFLEYAKKNGKFLNSTRLDESDYIKYLVNFFKKADVLIDKNELTYLVNKCGKDLYNLFSEAGKIVSFIKPGDKVTKKLIDEICVRNLDDNVFRLIDMINQNKKTEATKLYLDLLSEGKNPMEIFINLSYNYANLIVVKDLIEKSKSLRDICEITELRDFQVRNYMNASKYVSIEGLKERIKKITDLNHRNMKQELSSNLMMELML